jgi:hydroxyacylglutathione hydrolase
MNADQPARPANIVNIVAINQGARPLTLDEPRTAELTPDLVAARQADGALVVDTRPSAVFGAAHIPGALNIQLTAPEFEQRVGWITPLDTPLVLVTAGDDLVGRALHALAFLGLDARVTGYLKGGLDAWIAAGRATASVPQISVQELRRQLASPDPPRVLDVREPVEWNAGHIDGARLESHRLLPQRADGLPWPRDTPIAVVCHSGARSSIAASVLRRHGFTRVANVTGGMVAWKKEGLPVLDGAGCPIG